MDVNSGCKSTVSPPTEMESEKNPSASGSQRSRAEAQTKLRAEVE